MRTIERVYQVLVENSPNKLTTMQVAEKVKLTRGDVSTYLSKLYQQGKIEKSGTRPFYWYLKKEASKFKKFIGFDGSLTKVIDQCRESILYPPNGMSMLITGPSGVGKSFLARLVFEEAKRLKVISPEAKFVVLNVADYANNPEILSSVLFGYKKGAFTGAEQDKLGLVDQADNGYLFLDEVHRLSHESQEKLFTLMDSGCFYPLGENKTPHKVNVRFLFATTEKADELLLKTFLRRISLQVTLPKYIDRPLYERLQIVLHSFVSESQNIKRPLSVNRKTIISLVQTDKAGNIGSIQNEIKHLTAAAFAQAPSTSPLLIGIPKQPSILITKQINWQQSIQNIYQLTPLIDKLMLKIQSSLEQGENIEDQNFLIDDLLREDLAAISTENTKSVQGMSNDVLKAKYGINLSSKQINWQLCEQLLELIVILYDQMGQGTGNIGQLLQSKYPRSTYLFKKLLLAVLPNKEVKDYEYILFFPIFADLVKDLEKINYNALLLAHGKQTATSIQSVVNSLCGTYIFEAFDMPIDSSIQQINKEVQLYLDQQGKNVAGTIVLFDMGSLNQMFTEIKAISSRELLVINNITTAMALDVGIRIQQGQEFNQIAKASAHYGEATGVQYYEGFSDKKNIIVACMSGDGVSQELKHIMDDTLSGKLEIITIDYKKLRHLLDQQDRLFFCNTEFVITTTELTSKIPIEIVDVYDVLDKQGVLHLTRLLEDSGEEISQIKKMIDQFVRFFSFTGIRERLQILNPDTIIGEVQAITKRYEEYYSVELNEKVKLNLYTHIALMIERMVLAKRDSDETINSLSLNSKEKEFFSISKNILKTVEIKYNIKITDYEISLIYQLLQSYI